MAKNRLTLVLFFIGLLIVIIMSYHMFSQAYKLANTLASKQDYVSDEIYYVDTARRYLKYIFKINLSYYEWSNKTGQDYYNLEHPPLGKYIIALSMIICGDRPLCWKLPGLIEAFLIPIIIYLSLSLKFLKNNNMFYIISGIIAGIAAANDRILVMDSTVAMLDIHLAFFVTLTISFLIYKKYKTALIFGALASTVKMSGIAAIGGILLIFFLKSIYNRKILFILEKIILTILITIIVWIIVYIPLLLHFGPKELIDATLSALEWHTTSRPPGPPTSTPLGWLINSNPFVFSYSMVLAAAVTTPTVQLTAFISSLWIFIIILYKSILKRTFIEAPGTLILISTFIMYLLIYILGNHTFYSFYAVQLTPPAAVTLSEAFLLLLGLNEKP